MEDTVLKQYNIYISSSERDNGSPSSFSIYLPQPITLNSFIPSELRVFIDRAQIPFSYSQFNPVALNTQCAFYVVRGSTTYSNLSFTITSGNYNVLTLAQEFLDKMTPAISAAIVGYTPTLSYSYNGDTNHLRFTLEDDGTPTAIVIQNSTYTKLNLALGFTAQWAIDSTLPYVESTQDINCSPSRSLYITSTSLQQTQSWSAITTPFQTSSVLTMIPIQASPLLFITHHPNYVIKTTLSNTSISEIQLSLRDEQMNELYEMDLDWSLHLVVTEHKIDPLMYDMSRKELQLTREIDQPQDIRVTEEQRKLIEQYRQEEEKALQDLREQQAKRLQRYQAKLIKKQNKNLE
jgi:hypothetical protein